MEERKDLKCMSRNWTPREMHLVDLMMQLTVKKN